MTDFRSDDDIPVLTDAVRRPSAGKLSEEQIDALCDSLAADTWVLLDGLIDTALRNAQDGLRLQLNERLGDELPALIERTLREKLGEPTGK